VKALAARRVRSLTLEEILASQDRTIAQIRALRDQRGQRHEVKRLCRWLISQVWLEMGIRYPKPQPTWEERLHAGLP